MANTKGGFLTQQKEQAVNAGDALKERRNTLMGLINQMKPQLEKALPRIFPLERFTRMILTAISSNEKLLECTQQSFLGAMMTAAQLGLEPNTPLGQAYLIPYWNTKKNCYECQFQLGYRGLIELAFRSDAVTDIQAREVYENDVFEYELGLNPKLKHIPALTDRGEVILYYAIFRTKNGGWGYEVMSKEDVVKHKEAHNKNKKKNAKGEEVENPYSPWVTSFDEMAKKTVIKKVLKYAPLKTDFIKTVNADETIKTEISENMLDVKNEMYTIESPQPVEALQQAQQPQLQQEPPIVEMVPPPTDEM